MSRLLHWQVKKFEYVQSIYIVLWCQCSSLASIFKYSMCELIGILSTVCWLKMLQRAKKVGLKPHIFEIWFFFGFQWNTGQKLYIFPKEPKNRGQNCRPPPPPPPPSHKHNFGLNFKLWFIWQKKLSKETRTKSSIYARVEYLFTIFSLKYSGDPL